MSSTSTSSEVCWIEWFCGLNGNEFFCQVDRDYIADSFNLANLNSQVTFFQDAWSIILDKYIDDGTRRSNAHLLEGCAERLYGLIHARFIMTSLGLIKMRKKYLEGCFGYCPRVYCYDQQMLPIGLTDQLVKKCVKCYCPKCHEVYKAKSPSQALDGAYFGTSFPHMFFMTFPNYRPLTPKNSYTPKLFGFRVHKSACILPETDDDEKKKKECVKIKEINEEKSYEKMSI